MANQRNEINNLKTAIDIWCEFRESPRTKDSELVMNKLKDIELDWRSRYMELQEKFSRKTARKPVSKKPSTDITKPN
jgi:hypothetical protein